MNKMQFSRTSLTSSNILVAQFLKKFRKFIIVVLKIFNSFKQAISFFITIMKITAQYKDNKKKPRPRKYDTSSNSGFSRCYSTNKLSLQMLQILAEAIESLHVHHQCQKSSMLVRPLKRNSGQQALVGAGVVFSW